MFMLWEDLKSFQNTYFCRNDDKNYSSGWQVPKNPEFAVIVIFPEDIKGEILGRYIKLLFLQRNLEVTINLYSNLI